MNTSCHAFSTDPPSGISASSARLVPSVAPALAASGLSLEVDTLSTDTTFTAKPTTVIAVVLAGSAALMGEPEPVHVGAGSVLVIPPGERHGFCSFGNAEGLQLARLSFDAQKLLPRSDELVSLGGIGAALAAPHTESDGTAFRPRTLTIAPRHLSVTRDALARLGAEAAEARLGQSLLLRALLLELLVVLARAERAGTTDSDRHRARLERTLAFIHEHFRERLTLGELASRSGMSVSRFSCLFRETLGTSPLDYVSSARMREARRLLSDRSRSITEVAYAVGYQDSNYFSRAFKLHHGISPRESRQMSRIGRAPTASVC